MIEITIASEWNDAALSRLTAEVAAMGGSMAQREWVVGGSQELTTYKISLPGAELEAIAETYIGLSLRGDQQSVEALASRLA